MMAVGVSASSSFFPRYVAWRSSLRAFGYLAVMSMISNTANEIDAEDFVGEQDLSYFLSLLYSPVIGARTKG